MKYTCKLVKSTDNCEAARYIEDEEDLFVFNEKGTFWSANEFFYMVGEMSFEVVDGTDISKPI